MLRAALAYPRPPPPTPPFYRYTLNAHSSRYKTERDKISLGTCASQHLPLAGSCSEVVQRRVEATRELGLAPNVYTAQLVVGEVEASQKCERLSRSAARACGARALAALSWTAWTHFLKLVHVAKIGTKPCELESHRLRTNSSHMQPCFSGSLPGCAGQAPTHAPHARSLNVQLSPTLTYAQPHLYASARPQRLACELTHAPCVQLIHDARVRHRMRSSFGTVVTVSRRHTNQTHLIMLARVLALELLARQFEELRARRLVVGQCAARIARVLPLRAPIGRGRPAMRFGGLAWLAHRGCSS